MSKAFIRELDTVSDDELEHQTEFTAKVNKNYITPLGYVRLQDEMKQLLNVERPEMVKVVSWAAGLGDRSENADYLYGKKRLREIDKRIRFLTKRIGYAQIVDPTQQPQNKVYFGATVTVSDPQGNESRYSIVGMDEIDPAHGRISWISPLSKALLGREEGETITVMTPTGPQTLDILDIQYLPLE